MKRRALTPALLSVALAAAAPERADAEDVQAWSAIVASGPIVEGGRALVMFEAQARFRDDASALGSLSPRAALGWRIRDGVDAWVGAARITTTNDGVFTDERRAWLQANVALGQAFGGAVTSRTRLERRTRASGGDDAGWRLRQQVRWTRPVGGEGFAWVASNEIFFGLNGADWGQREGLDQNRAFIGASWRVGPDARFEAGYLRQHIERPIGEDPGNSVAVATLAIAL
ncbi:MAG: DUF2490 domain-containing protein [Hyphomonadaceae bacterium]|nr:DUF2490 domain-containing protein [Hyphomonadaceae bacterium]